MTPKFLESMIIRLAKEASRIRNKSTTIPWSQGGEELLQLIAENFANQLAPLYIEGEPIPLTDSLASLAISIPQAFLSCSHDTAALTLHILLIFFHWRLKPTESELRDIPDGLELQIQSDNPQALLECIENSYIPRSSSSSQFGKISSTLS